MPVDSDDAPEFGFQEYDQSEESKLKIICTDRVETWVWLVNTEMERESLKQQYESLRDGFSPDELKPIEAVEVYRAYKKYKDCIKTIANIQEQLDIQDQELLPYLEAVAPKRIEIVYEGERHVITLIEGEIVCERKDPSSTNPLELTKC